jgi:hypothetical protein
MDYDVGAPQPGKFSHSIGSGITLAWVAIQARIK